MLLFLVAFIFCCCFMYKIRHKNKNEHLKRTKNIKTVSKPVLQPITASFRFRFSVVTRFQKNRFEFGFCCWKSVGFNRYPVSITVFVSFPGNFLCEMEKNIAEKFTSYYYPNFFIVLKNKNILKLARYDVRAAKNRIAKSEEKGKPHSPPTTLSASWQRSQMSKQQMSADFCKVIENETWCDHFNMLSTYTVSDNNINAWHQQVFSVDAKYNSKRITNQPTFGK